MKTNVPKISYNQESNVLSIEVKKVKSVDSDIHGNLVVDYDKDGNITRINLYGFNLESFKESAQALRDFSRNSHGVVAST